MTASSVHSLPNHRGRKGGGADLERDWEKVGPILSRGPFNASGNAFVEGTLFHLPTHFYWSWSQCLDSRGKNRTRNVEERRVVG